MSVFTGKGKSIKEEMKKRELEKKKRQDGEKLDYKKIKINKDLKKEGDSIRVRVLGAEDYTTYEAHGSYEKGIYTTPCINPTGDGENRCLMCEASKHEGYKELKPSTRFLFAFYDIDMEMVRYIDVSYGQGGTLMDDIEEYEDSLNDVAFTLKRQGTGTKTAYKLSPILKLKGDDQARFEKAEGMTVEENFFEKALYIKSTNQMGIDLENADFDVEGLLGYEIQDESSNNDGDAKQQNNEEVDPEKVF
ncbi:hypothetical protein ABES03_08525 [Neobacillus rhizosphaerae]|uniref:hypothetical protein n=1 Tax=Neobacillus rhizosphaerae TaxID=2880965 RepID=UPI003D288383